MPDPEAKRLATGQERTDAEHELLATGPEPTDARRRLLATARQVPDAEPELLATRQESTDLEPKILSPSFRGVGRDPVDFSAFDGESEIETGVSWKGKPIKHARAEPLLAAARPSGRRAPFGKEKHVMSSTTSSKSKATLAARLQALIKGLQAQFPNGQFTLGNVVYTTAALVQALQSLLDAITAVSTAQAKATVAVAALRDTKAKVDPLVLALRRNLLVMFGNAADILALFGLEPRKAPAPRTGAEIAAAAAKAKATRRARGTTSKKQKLAVVGNVTGITVTPITAPK